MPARRLNAGFVFYQFTATTVSTPAVPRSDQTRQEVPRNVAGGLNALTHMIWYGNKENVENKHNRLMELR